MIESDTIKSLKNLVEEFGIATRLEQYSEVSNLCSKINVRLIDMIDSSLHETEDDSDGEEADEEESIDKNLSQFVGRLCNRLRLWGELASAYEEVCQFARLQDMAALARIVGALKPEEINNEVLKPFIVMIKVVQQSIMLLRSMRQNQDEWDLASRAGYLDPRKINCVYPKGIGFASYQIDDVENSLSDEINIDESGKSLSEQLMSLDIGSFPNEQLESELKSTWFNHFIQTHLDNKFPVDRFTLLISIWIAGVECHCRALDPIMNGLIDGLVHEEAQSNSVDDMMQLSQLGSIWLSERRRLKFSSNNNNNNNNINNNNNNTGFQLNKQRSQQLGNEDDLSSDIDDYSESDSNSELDELDEVSSSSSNSGQNNSSDYKADKDESGLVNNKIHRNHARDLRRELRQLIEGTFLHGFKCYVCGDKQSGKLLAMLEQDSCQNCSSQVVVERCSLSFRPIPIIRLDSLLGFRSKARSLTLVSGSEWLRFYLREADLFGMEMRFNAKQPSSARDRNLSDQLMTGERVQISEDFQKLTVIRPNEESESDSDSNDSDNANQEQDNENNDDLNKSADHSQPWYSFILNSMMKERQFKLTSSKAISDMSGPMEGPSESMRMIRYVGSDATNLILNMCDLLIMDLPLDDAQLMERHSLRIGLAVSDSWRCWGPIMSCSTRSKVSQLQLGCGRLFNSFELLKSATSQKQNGNQTCPFCSLDLIQLKSLNQYIGFK